MEYACGHYLMQYYDKKVPIVLDNTSNKCLVIIETRPSFWLPLVIKNAIDKCPGYNLYVFGTPNVNQFLRHTLEGEYYNITINTYMRNIQEYNQLLTSSDFWEQIKEEHIIIFQLDTLFLRNPTEQHIQYDYNGAVCGKLNRENEFIINGGLSYRSKKAMLFACKLIDDSYHGLPEDVIFTKLMRKHKELFKLPSIAECNDFSIETLGNFDKVIGIHGTDKYYILDKSIYQLLMKTKV